MLQSISCPIAEPSREELRYVDELPDQGVARIGWGPQLRRRAGYFLPDAYYEALVARSVEPGCAWLDVGCGRDLFPHNEPLARVLAARCGRLVGVDPDANIEQNPFLHSRVRQPIDELEIAETFDLVTLRMVVEHITDPPRAVQNIARCVRSGGKVIVYTVYRWSPAALAACLTPMAVHHRAKRFLWRSEERDTFPVAYRMNTRRQLARAFSEAGFREAYFAYLDDCRSFARFRRLLTAELWAWRTLRACGLHYPEMCLLGVYERI